MSIAEKDTEESNNLDCKEVIRGKWNQAIKQFHMNRTVDISRLPDGITEEDVREMLSFLEIEKTEINKTTHTAKITLKQPESFDPLLQSHKVPTSCKGHEIIIKYGTVDNFLCVSNLPPDFTESQFTELVQKFGPVDRSFLIYDHLTDQSKEYGLVQYCSRAVSFQARNLLHQKELLTCTLYCDWLDHKLVTYEDLYSKCIYVDHLPTNYCDLGNFRKIFSSVANPLYCQLAHKFDKTAVFGLAEYITSADASLSCDKLNNYKLEDNFIRTFLTIPSVPAVKLLNNLVTETSSRKKNAKGLLPTPTLPISVLPHMQLSQIWNNLGQLDGFSPTPQLLSRSPLSLFPQQQITNQMNIGLNHLLCLPSLSPSTPIGTNHVIERNNQLCSPTYNSPIIPKKLSFLSPSNTANEFVRNRELRHKQQIGIIGHGRPNVKPLTPHQQSNIMANSLMPHQFSIMAPNPNADMWSSPRRNNSSDLLKNIFKSSPPKPSITESLSFSPLATSIIRQNHPLFSPPLPTFRQQLQLSVSPNMLASYTNGALRLDSPYKQDKDHWRTPKREKRKLHSLLPVPEESPENDYIGQHSQGIGGHYADSYFCSKKIRH